MIPETVSSPEPKKATSPRKVSSPKRKTSPKKSSKKSPTTSKRRAVKRTTETKKRSSKRKSNTKSSTKTTKKTKKKKKSKVSEKVQKYRNAEKPRKKYSEIPIYVVDEHDGSMVCALRSLEQGYLPSSFKLMHFDSHPDLGCVFEEWKDIDTIYNRDYSIRDLYDQTDIATWIVPMALSGHTPFVVWVCGSWCDQFPVGCWDLLVGKSKVDGSMKIGTKGDKRFAALDYWESGDSLCDEADFEYCREWTLMVVRYGKNCELSESQRARLVKEFSEGPWVLDIDEDFFSCNNPYFDEFRDLFGEKMQSTLQKVYEIDAEHGPDIEDEILDMFRDQTYNKPWNKFVRSPLAKDILSAMQCTSKKAVLKKFHKFLRTNFPNGGMDDDAPEGECEEWCIKDFFTLDDVHRCGQLACLPHHISTAKEIKKLVNEVDELFEELPDPLIVTVATSRLDRYLPDSQAGAIHNFVETMLMSRYSSENVLRLDKPKFSVDSGETSEDSRGSRYVTDILE